jgi:predicted N-acetyltransferase YhbS
MRTIRRATREDAEIILAIQKRAFAEEGRRCKNWTIPPLTESLDAIIDHIETQTVFVACNGTQVIGSARGLSAGAECTIRGVSVEPEHQGSGVGSRLLRALESSYPAATRFELLTNTCLPGNVRFYERHGYVVAELRRFTETIELAFMTKAGSPAVS